jgi:hypothetical protein
VLQLESVASLLFAPLNFVYCYPSVYKHATPGGVKKIRIQTTAKSPREHDCSHGFS